MREIGDEKRGVPDLDTHDVIYDTRSRYVPHVDKIVSGSLLDGRFHRASNEGIEILVIEFHGDKAVIAYVLSSLFFFILLPSVQSEINTEKANPPSKGANIV